MLDLDPNMDVFEPDDFLLEKLKRGRLEYSESRRFWSIRSKNTGATYHGLRTYKQAVELANQIAIHENLF